MSERLQWVKERTKDEKQHQGICCEQKERKLSGGRGVWDGKHINIYWDKSLADREGSSKRGNYGRCSLEVGWD